MMNLQPPAKPAKILAQTAHRPWPHPAGAWVMAQSWSQLLFAHWPVSPEVLRPLIPASLTIDIFEGQAWIGVVPFYMSHVRARNLPLVPGTNHFCELNVRTYVTDGSKSGVWFFSLEASNALAVFGARNAFHLPYFQAQMSLQRTDDTVTYESRRMHQGAANAQFSATYCPTSPVYHSTPGTLVSWLTERYCLYTTDGSGHLYRGDIHHAPWPLQDAQADIQMNTMAEVAGITLPDTPPLLHYAERLDVVTWYLTRI
ncbi:MAG: DUF2071 domain-containing protein [Chloroflexota bacterium]